MVGVNWGSGHSVVAALSVVAGQDLGVGALAECDGGELRQGVINRVADQRQSAAHTFGIEWCVTEVDAVTECDFTVGQIEPEAAAWERIVEVIKQTQRLELGGCNRLDGVDDKERDVGGLFSMNADDDEVSVLTGSIQADELGTLRRRRERDLQ